MKNGILGCPTNLVHDLSPACKMIMVKKMQTYSVHILVCYMLAISRSRVDSSK